MNQYEILKHYFGYDTFRDGQEKLIRAILEGRDVLGIMPTGAGKSLCYQIPALMMGGITLVISPLISLMKDQVSNLNQAGILAAYLNSSLTPGQYRKVLELAVGTGFQTQLFKDRRLYQTSTQTPGSQCFYSYSYCRGKRRYHRHSYASGTGSFNHRI